MGTGWIAVQRLEIRKRIEAGRYLPFIRYLAEGEISLGMFYHDKFYHLLLSLILEKMLERTLSNTSKAHMLHSLLSNFIGCLQRDHATLSSYNQNVPSVFFFFVIKGRY